MQLFRSSEGASAFFIIIRGQRVGVHLSRSSSASANAFVQMFRGCTCKFCFDYQRTEGGSVFVQIIKCKCLDIRRCKCIG